jgi:hypothetical protein
MLHMLQWLYTYVISVCFKCFICFRRMLQKCFMLQVFHEQAREAGACGPRVRAGSRAGVGNGAARETEQRSVVRE